jgi:hypothetical protein
MTQQVFKTLIALTFADGRLPDRDEVDSLESRVMVTLKNFAARNTNFNIGESMNDFRQTLSDYVQDPQAFLTAAQASHPAPGSATTPATSPATAPDVGMAAHRETATSPAEALPPPHSEPLPPEAAPDGVPRPGTGRRLSARGWSACALALVAGGLWWSSTSCGWPLSGCYDSGWTAANSRTSQSLRFTHGLGQAPTDVRVLYSHTAGAEEIVPVMRTWTVGESGNPVSIIADGSQVTLQIVTGLPLHGTWSPAGNWRRQDQGFFRVIARK